MNNNRILCIVVMYHPNIEQAVQNIKKYASEIDKLLIWINDCDDYSISYLHNHLHTIDYSIISSSRNAGLSIAYNYALKYAVQKGYELLMTMDQDSVWCHFASFLNVINKVIIRNSSIGIFGPEIIPIEQKNKNQITKDRCVYAVNHVISSGAIYKTSVLHDIGGFNKNYFIDAIDEEVCYRAKNKGIGIVKVSSGVLFQEFGNRTKKELFGKTIITSNYSAKRVYYIVRNHIWLVKSQNVDKKTANLIIYNYVLSPSIKVILFESHKLIKLKSIICGIIDGIKGERR